MDSGTPELGKSAISAGGLCLPMGSRIGEEETVGKCEEIRLDAWGIVRAALAAVDPRACVRRALVRHGDLFWTGTNSYDVHRVRVVGMGKAAGAMARAAEEILADRIDTGLVVTADGYWTPTDRVEVIEAGHPVPDERGLDAARRIVDLVDDAEEGDLVVVLISGGGSALLTFPADGLSLSDLAKTNELLLRSGAPIAAMNAVRKHLDQLKGGQLARRAAPARVLALILSDVPGDPLDVIASGPTVPDPTTYADAEQILQDYGLWDKVPPSVREHLARGAAGEAVETPKPGDPLFARVGNVLVGTGSMAAEAAVAEGEARGYHGLILTTTLVGEAREAGKVIASLAQEVVRFGRPVPPPGLLVAAGETTVTVRGGGKGGRNQELALSAAIGIAGLEGVVVCALGTDGRDGPTSAAGAIVDGKTVDRANRSGINVHDALRQNDSHRALDASDDLVITGPTGTNVGDLCFVLVK